MLQESLIVSPGPDSKSVRADDGRILRPPADWILVPPGDPGLTRRIKAAGPTWTVQEIHRNKKFSRGIWTAAANVTRIQADLASERATPEYAKKRDSDLRRREREQADYVKTFHETVVVFLAFNPRYANLAETLAHAVTTHATPVGSGTVARTERIPVEERAEAAVIAWMRHQTTAYDNLAIPRIKGKRREVRRMLAGRSRALLDAYRGGRDVNAATCPLQRALSEHSVARATG